MSRVPAPELTLDQIDRLFKETCTKGASGTPKEAGRLFAGEIIRELNRLWKAKLDNQLQHLQSLASSDTWDERTEAVNREEVLKRARYNYEMLSNAFKEQIFERMNSIPFNIRSDVVTRVDAEIEFED